MLQVKRLLKWLAVIIGSLLSLAILAGIVLYWIGNARFHRPHEVTARLLTEVSMDSASIAWGEHLSKIHGCQLCHGEKLEGQVFLDIPPFLAVASNLTSGRGGRGPSYTEADWDRAIRYGVRLNGRALLAMPSKSLHNLSDSDTEALIAYLKQLPPVDNKLPDTDLRTLGAILIGTDAFDPTESVSTEIHRGTAPTVGLTAEYGDYLTQITCIACHGVDLRGGQSLDPDVLGPDLAAAGVWSYERFVEAMRTGVKPGGTQLDASLMPWPAFQHMSDEELQAIHLYLKTIAP